MCLMDSQERVLKLFRIFEISKKLKINSYLVSEQKKFRVGYPELLN